jgi:hypothetical protein
MGIKNNKKFINKFENVINKKFMLILTQKILKNCKNIETVILNTSATLSLILKLILSPCKSLLMPSLLLKIVILMTREN